MNSERLLQHFDRISEAPDAIPRLRRFILDLAVRGKLVEQDPNDEPAADLLKRIQGEKTQMVKIGVLKKEKPLPAVESDEVSFSVPLGWELVRLASLCGLENGDRSKNYPSRDELVTDGIPFINAGHLEADEVRLDDMNFITQQRFDILNSGKIRDGDILFCLRGSLGKTALVSGLAQGAIASSLVIIRLAGHLNVRFMLSYLSSPLSFEMIKRFDNGTAQPNLSSADLGMFVVPLPPLAEQHRIVAKVDELMALCDQLEAAKTEREQIRDRLVVASLYRLNSPTDMAETDAPDLPARQADTFRDYARFVLKHLSHLTTRPEHIKHLRQTILNLAVRGKLVPQDSNDEPASEMLKQIQAEKARLIKVGTIPRQKLASNNSNGLIFERPANWEAVNFSAVCNLVTSGSRGWAEFYSNTGPKFIRAQNIRFGRLQLDDLACVSLPEKAEGMRTQVSHGDLLVVITGAGVTNPAMLDLELGEAYVSQHVALIKPTAMNLSRWLLLCLMAPAGGRAELVERAYGAGKPGLNLDNIRSLRIPLPPLAEQHRIVARVDELMALCDQLEAQLAATEADSRRLLEAVLHEVLAPELEETV
jgi:type I restriction enzyme, S subunit